MTSHSPRGGGPEASAAQISTTHPLRVDPRYPLQDGSMLPADGGLGRTASRRRKVSGQGAQVSLDQLNDVPLPPEAPQSARVAPPITYRDPYGNSEAYLEQSPSSRSFAARAGIVPNNLDVEQPHAMAIEQNFNPDRRHSRRGSTTGNTYINSINPQSPLIFSPHGVPQPTVAASRPDRNGSNTGRKDNEASRASASKARPKELSNISSNPDSPVVRSATNRSTHGQSREWAADRSPLQKLEVKLNDISKEEKRARVELAEQKLRETLARSGSRHASQPTGAPIRQVSTSKRAISGPEINRRSAHGITSESKGSPTVREKVPESPRREQQARRSLGTENDLVKNGVPTRSSSQRHSGSVKSPSVRRRSEDTGRGEDRGVRFHHEVDHIGSPDAADLATPNAQRAAGTGQSFSKSTRQQVLTGREGEATYDGSGEDHKAAKPDPVPPSAVRSHQHGLKYEIPPQTAAGIETRKQVGFGSRLDEKTDLPTHHRPHLSAILRGRHDKTTPGALEPPTNRHLNEWQTGKVARLTLADFEQRVQASKVDKNKAWWEQSKSSKKRHSRSEDYQMEEDADDAYVDDQNLQTTFNPPLLLKCGPMIRYTGMKRDKLEQAGSKDRETWRGSVMIVTEDDVSTYDPAPSLRLFHQPMQLLPQPPPHVEGDGEGEGLESEYVDPVGGLPKISRTGGTIYVKPVEDLDEGKDVSRIEDDDGLYEETRTANVPTSYGKADELLGLSPHSPHPRNRAAQKEGRQVGRYREVAGVRLHAERGVTFWRFNLEVELGDQQQRIAYRINKGAAVGFWVPARGHTMNVMFHSCNGFSLSVDSNIFSGPDPLWRDVLNAHQLNPFHVMIGGGDQIYNDAVMRQTHLFQEWLEIRNPVHKHETPFSPEMRDELETFYLDRYSMWFSQGLFGMANSQIPMVNQWDDHDIIDGYGSYPHHFMSNPVFCGLGNIAFKYYMLFQHQSVVDETSSDEPSWLLGASPGPYINELSRSQFMFLGKNVAFLGLDCRTERMRDEVLSEATYDSIFDRLHRELIKGETKHLIVLLGIPIAYPRLVWLENVLTSRAFDPIKALGRIGMLGNFMNKFDGGVEILDDLDDHWTAKNHKEERNWFIEELQEIAAEKSVRVTILGGDVHLAAVGQFYSNKRLAIPKHHDFRYMPNVISSAIVNTPPPDMMADILNKRNKIHHLNAETDEDMIPMFTHDVDGKPRNNKRLLPKRNWCSISEYHPGSTPPPTPPSSSPTASEESLPEPEPSRIQRTLSLGRGNSKPAKLIRRLSLGNREPDSNQNFRPRSSGQQAEDSPLTPPKEYVRSHPAPAPQQPARYETPPIPTRPVNTFHRRPTNLSEKAAAKGGAMDEQVDLELGLDISLNCEIKQGDPSGSTEQYRLLVPALFYDGPLPQHRQNNGILKRLGSVRGNKAAAKQAHSDESASESESEEEQSHSESEAGSQTSEDPPRRPGGGMLRRLSSAFSRPTNLLQKRVPQEQDFSRAPEPFKPRSQAQPNPSVPSSGTYVHQARPQGGVHGQIARSSPTTAYGQRPSPQSGSPAQSVPRSAMSSNAKVSSPLQRTQGAPALSSPTGPAARTVVHNQTAPLDYDSDEMSDEAEVEKRSSQRFSRSGASKFFGEDLPHDLGAANGGAAAGGEYGGRSKRNSLGYGGIDAYKDEKKGWRKFF